MHYLKCVDWAAFSREKKIQDQEGEKNSENSPVQEQVVLKPSPAQHMLTTSSPVLFHTPHRHPECYRCVVRSRHLEWKQLESTVAAENCARVKLDNPLVTATAMKVIFLGEAAGWVLIHTFVCNTYWCLNDF